MKSRAMTFAAIVLLAATQVATAELGRLFLSPAERDALDRARYAAPATAAEPDSATSGAQGFDADAAAEPDNWLPESVVTVDGYVRRSAGPSTVWVNGTDSHQGNLAEQGLDARDLRLEHERVRVPLRNGETTLLLKPGESFDPETAHISDAYQRRPEAPVVH